ncbi:hypothetical protein T484DRAFT_2017431 [Baffinella frigidus]|nr:hypothetical protein T484DRAFT_2017431 [Cryptophyta sp. CCMP2293]
MKRSISGDDALVACEWSTLYKFLSEEFSPPSSPRSQPLPIRCSSSGTVDTELSPDQDVMAAAVAMVPAELHDGSAPSERRSSGDDTALIACEWSNLYRFLSEFSPPSSPRSGTTDSPSSASKASVLLNALSKHTGHAAFPHKKWASKLSLLLTRFRRNEQRTAQPAGSADSIRTGCFPKLWSSPAPEVYIPTEEDRITEENTTANLANLIPISHSTREREPEEPSLGTLQRTTSAPIATLCDSGKKSSLKRIVSDAETLGGGGGIPRMSPKPPLSLTFGDVTYNVDRPAAAPVMMIQRSLTWPVWSAFSAVTPEVSEGEALEDKTLEDKAVEEKTLEDNKTTACSSLDDSRSKEGTAEGAGKDEDAWEAWQANEDTWGHA